MAVFDRDAVFTEPVVLTGEQSIEFLEGVTITHNLPFLFLYQDCRARIVGHNTQIVQGANSVFVSSDHTRGGSHVWDLYIEGFSTTTGAAFFNNNRGGRPPYTERTNMVTIKGVSAECQANPITIYSQNGPVVSFHGEDLVLRSRQSHTMYLHPNVNVTLKGVSMTPLGVGINSPTALALHNFSGGGVPGGADYIHMEGVTSTQPVEFANNNGVLTCNDIKLRNCSFPIYHSNHPVVSAEDNRFIGYSLVSGTFQRCTGRLTLTGDSLLEQCTLDELGLPNTGVVTLKNTVVRGMAFTAYTPPAPTRIELVVDHSTVLGIAFNPLVDATVVVVGDTKRPTGGWGYTIPESAYKQK